MPKDVIGDLCDRMDLLRLRYNVVFNRMAQAVPAPPYIPLAEALMQGLAEGHPHALTMARTLVDPGDLEGSAFWGTPFGQLLFLAGGYTPGYGGSCSQTVAAAVLGCSRQWVSAMVAEGKLSSTGDRRVLVDQVRDVLRKRIDRLVKQV